MTAAQAALAGLIPLYEYDRPSAGIKVGNGTVTLLYREWLARERDRITRHQDRVAAIVSYAGDDPALRGTITLWVTPVAPMEEE